MQSGDKSHRELTLSRRQLLVAAAAAPFAALLLEGCGGSGGGGASAVGTQSVPVSLALPKGVAPSSVQLVTARGAVPATAGQASATVIGGYPTMALVLDQATSKVVMVGMIDPSAAANRLDATNVAATLLFLSVGGSQLFGTLRNALWKAVLADPATATLATVIAARLDADPFALDDGDTQVTAALAQAVHALNAATLAAANPQAANRAPRPAAPSRGRAALPPPASPAVVMGAGYHNNGLFLDNPVSNGDTYYDYLVITKLGIQEWACCIVEAARVNDGVARNVTPIKKLAGPFSFSWPTATDAIVRSDPISVPIVDPADDSETLFCVSIAPVFGAPAVPPDPANQAFETEVNTLLAAMYQRAVVMIANTLFLEALGLGGLTFTLDQVKAETDALNALGGNVAAALSKAAQGSDLIGSVNALIAACTADPATAAKVYQILEPIRTVPGGQFQSANAATQLAKTGQLSKVMDFFGAGDSATTFRGSMLAACEYGSTAQARPILYVAFGLDPVRYTIAPSATTYAPGGAPVTLKATPSPAKTNSRRKYHWKLVTSGSATISDGAGGSGLEFDSLKDTVTLTTGAQASGNQTVSVTVYNTEADTPVVAGSAILAVPPSNVPLNGQVTVNVTRVADSLKSQFLFGAHTWRRLSATKSAPDPTNGVELDLSFQNVPDDRSGSFQWLGWVPRVAAGTQVDTNPQGFGPALNLGLSALLGNEHKIEAFRSVSGSMSITKVDGNQIYFTGSATMIYVDPIGAGVPDTMTIDITVDGNTTVTGG